MLLVDFFSEDCCKGTELVEGWYWYQDDGDDVGGPYDSEKAAIEAAEQGSGWSFPYWKDGGS
jgi:hypothetical protein